jgi:hypothetical protein
LAEPLICLGDGHDGICNIYDQVGNPLQRQEILDWYHLVENLGKVGGSQQRLDAVEACLWRGDVDGAIAQFNDWQHERVTTSQPLLLISTSIDPGLSTMVIIKPKVFQLVRGQLNQQSNNLGLGNQGERPGCKTEYVNIKNVKPTS